MTGLGDLKQFLGMQIFRDRKQKTTFVGQERYFQKVLERCWMQDCKGVSTPMETKLSLVKLDDKDIIGELEYQSLVGSIIYGMLGTCPDLAYSILTLGKFNSCPVSEHHEAAKRVLRYLQKAESHCLRYRGG